MAETQEQGRLVVISGPSGSGKTTICNHLLADPDVCLSISDTTRAPRTGEENGTEYHYLSREAFLRRKEAGAYLESAEVHGEFYGTPRQPIEDAIAAGKTVLLNIDPQGARTLREQGVSGVFVFLLPPSEEELRRRLEKRRSETPEERERRLRAATREIEIAKSEEDLYDVLLVNDEIEETVRQIRHHLQE